MNSDEHHTSGNSDSARRAATARPGGTGPGAVWLLAALLYAPMTVGWWLEAEGARHGGSTGGLASLTALMTVAPLAGGLLGAASGALWRPPRRAVLTAHGVLWALIAVWAWGLYALPPPLRASTSDRFPPLPTGRRASRRKRGGKTSDGDVENPWPAPSPG